MQQKILLCLAMGVLLTLRGLGQDNPGQIRKQLVNLVTRYQDHKYLSFDVKYSYAQEEQPDKILDTLSGRFKMHGQHFWYILDRTETILTDSCSIVLYPEDNIMYVAKSSPAARQLHPLYSLDSILKSNDGYKLTSFRKGKKLVVTVVFPQTSSYKKLEYHIDTDAGLLTKLRAWVSGSLMLAPEASADQKGVTGYAIVEADFNNYHSKQFDLSVFDSGRYFQRTGDKLKSVGNYQQYKIFPGSINF